MNQLSKIAELSCFTSQGTGSSWSRQCLKFFWRIGLMLDGFVILLDIFSKWWILNQCLGWLWSEIFCQRYQIFQITSRLPSIIVLRTESKWKFHTRGQPGVSKTNVFLAIIHLTDIPPTQVQTKFKTSFYTRVTFLINDGWSKTRVLRCPCFVRVFQVSDIKSTNFSIWISCSLWFSSSTCKKGEKNEIDKGLPGSFQA